MSALDLFSTPSRGPQDHACETCGRPCASYGLMGADNLDHWFCAADLPPAWFAAAPPQSPAVTA